MNDCHLRSGANYRIVRRMDRTYGVEVKIPGALPTLVTSFASKDAALGWIEKRQREPQAIIYAGGVCFLDP